MVSAVQNDSVQKAVNQSNKARHEAVSKRKEVLLGTNQYPNFSEMSNGKTPLEHRCACGDNAEDTPLVKLETARAASEFEDLRLQTERSGKRPGFPSVEEGIKAALEANADIVVLCSSDDEYAEYAISAYQALDGRAMFIVAGAPACMEDLKAAGIENFIHVRCNVLDTLKEYNHKLGIN